MKRLLAACVVAATAVLLPAFPHAAAPVLPAAGARALDAFLSGQVARGVIPGVVVHVVNRDAVLYSRAFGTRNTARNVPLTTDSIFRIASMTKAVTTVAAMMLVEQGKVKLDDEIATYIPAFASMQVMTRYDEKAGTYETRPATKPITIRELLTHTSGIGYTWSDPGLALVQRKTNTASETELPLVHEPGEKWTYGPSTKVLGDLVEKVTGERIDLFTDRHIAGPLGMNDTFYEVPKAKYDRVVTTHQKSTAGTIVETQNPASIPVTLRGDGGLFSTAPDYGRFLQMILNDGQLGRTRLLEATTVAEMLRPQTNGLRVRLQPTAQPDRSRPYPLGVGEDVWGFGFQLADPRKPDPHQRRPGSGSWAGIWNTFFWVDPTTELGVIVMMQMMPFYDAAAIQTLRGVERRVYEHVRSTTS